MATKNRLMRQPAKVGDNTQSTYRVVPDADAVYATARAAGALIVLEFLHGNGRLGVAVCTSGGRLEPTKRCVSTSAKWRIGAVRRSLRWT